MPAEERQFYQDTILKKSTTNSTMSSSSSFHSGSMTATTPTTDVPMKSDENISPPHPASRGTKSNGTREAHHVTFAESHTEHVTSEQKEDNTVIVTSKDNMHTVHVISTNNINGQGNGSYLDFQEESSHDNQTPHHLADPNISISSSSPVPQMAPLTPIIKLQRSASTESHENPFLADGELSQKASYIISHSTISRSELKIEDPDQNKGKPIPEEPLQKTEASAVHSARPNEINVKDQNGKLEEPITPTSVEIVEKANASNPEPQQAEEVKLKDNKKCKCCTIM